MNQESEVVSILRDLIRFDTSNPPGNELPAVRYIEKLLKDEGIETAVVESEPGRANIVARLRGSGKAPALMLSAHLDVVPASGKWTHPPFAAEVADGAVWGRGAVDMKHMAAMSLVTLLELKRRKVPLERDLVFAGVADEETGGLHGAGFLVDKHPDLIKAGFCFTEVGGMSIPMAKGTMVPVQVAEKGYLWFKLRARGSSGHGSSPSPGSAVEKLSAAVQKITTRSLRYHLTGSAKGFFKALARSQKAPASTVLLGLLSGKSAGLTLKMVPAEQRASFRAMLHETAAVTILSAGKNVNVVPLVAEAQIDGRFLPGISQEGFLDEIRSLIGPGFELEPICGGPSLEMPSDTPLMETIVNVMSRHLPGAKVVPYLMPGTTDAKHYARAGITTYGFAPVALKRDEPFASLYHAPDERISIAGLETGLVWLSDVVKEFCAKS